jgi:hypothetical protein
LWTDKLDWQHIFKYPEQYIHNLKGDVEIEMNFFYKMPPELRAKFSKTVNIEFDIESEYRIALANNRRPKVVIEKSIDHHALMCVENSETLLEAKQLAKELADDIESRVRHFTNCLSSSTKNYRDWLIDDYKTRLLLSIGRKFREKLFLSE